MVTAQQDRTAAIAWEAVSAFTVMVAALRIAADSDPAFLFPLALVASDPWMLATVLVMAAAGRAR